MRISRLAVRVPAIIRWSSTRKLVTAKEVAENQELEKVFQERLENWTKGFYTKKAE